MVVMATTAGGGAVPPRLSQIDTGAPDAELRNTFIGGSEAFELLGEKQYGRGCARELAYRKMGVPEDAPAASRGKQRAISMRSTLKRGQVLEDLVARLYMDETGRSLIRRHRLVRNPDHPGAAVHTDRIILAQGERDTGDCEIKTHAEGPFLNI